MATLPPARTPAVHRAPTATQRLRTLRADLCARMDRKARVRTALRIAGLVGAAVVPVAGLALFTACGQ